MYIGDFIKEYQEANGVSIEDFATKAGLTVTEIEALENNLQEDGTVIPVAMRQIKGIACSYECTNACSYGSDSFRSRISCPCSS